MPFKTVACLLPCNHYLYGKHRKQDVKPTSEFKIVHTSSTKRRKLTLSKLSTAYGAPILTNTALCLFPEPIAQSTRGFQYFATITKIGCIVQSGKFNLCISPEINL